MSRRSSARLVKLQSNVVLIEKARVETLASLLADVVECHALAVESLYAPGSPVPPKLAALSCRAMEQRSANALLELSRAEQKLLEDGRQLKLLEGRAARAVAQEAAAAGREQLADVIERLGDTRARV